MRRTTCAAVVVFSIVIIACSSLAGAAAAGRDLFLVSVGRGPGALGSFWYATVWIHNPSTETAAVTVAFLERGVANLAPVHSTIMVDPGETRTLDDALFTLFGFDQAFGALHITADEDVVAAARSYNLTTAGLAESQGQFMAAMPTELAISAGEATSIPGITQPTDGSFRCNFAVVETAGASAQVAVRLRDPEGNELAIGNFDLAPFEPRQVNIAQLNGATSVSGGRLELAVVSGAGQILSLASMVGNGAVSQDPSTLEMEYEITPSAATGDGDITAVFANEGLSGGGVTGDVTLGIAEGGITTKKIADGAVTIRKLGASGSSSGQVLTSTGSTVAWQDPPSGSGDGDITAVTAGVGLSGGGATGDVTLSLADGGVTSAKISTNAVTEAKINPAAVTTGKLSASGSSSGQVLTSTGSTVAWQDPPSGSGDGDITAVAAGGGLSGGGATGDVTLSIADGGVTSAKIAQDAITSNKIADGQVLTADLGNAVVTQAKLSASGGSAGQVLGTNGSALLWQNASNFTLPYSGTTSTSGDVMYLRNSGGGRAMQVVSSSDTALWAQSTSGAGIDARSSSNVGVIAISTSNDGIKGFSAGNAKSGVYGEHSQRLGAAVFGRNTYRDNRGCLGCEDAGVFGDNGAGTRGYLGEPTYAVHGIAAGMSLAGVFEGLVLVSGVNGYLHVEQNLTVDGTVTKSGGSFRIDHPLDPENQYLYHSFVESPDMMNVYNGNVVTDGDGFVRVTLPDWFDVLNRDFRYQLTVIGGGEQWAFARIAEEIADDAFVIQTSVPNTKVSWQVTGIRKDAWAEAHRIPVEETKPGTERGRYLHPELFGQPADKSIMPGPPARLPRTEEAGN